MYSNAQVSCFLPSNMPRPPSTIFFLMLCSSKEMKERACSQRQAGILARRDCRSLVSVGRMTRALSSPCQCSSLTCRNSNIQRPGLTYILRSEMTVVAMNSHRDSLSMSDAERFCSIGVTKGPSHMPANRTLASCSRMRHTREVQI